MVLIFSKAYFNKEFIRTLFTFPEILVLKDYITFIQMIILISKFITVFRAVSKKFLFVIYKTFSRDGI